MWTKCNGSLTKYKQGKQSVMDVQQSMNKVLGFVNKVWISTKCQQTLNKMQTEFKRSINFALTLCWDSHRIGAPKIDSKSLFLLWVESWQLQK